MNKRIDFTLSEDELSAILEAMNYSKYKEVRPRATAIHMLHLGRTALQVAEVMNVTKVTIYQWFHAFKAKGSAGLRDREGRGRRRKATDAYMRLLEEALESHPPADYGYEFSIWTVTTLAAHLHEKTGIQLSERALQDLLKARGYVYRRPKYSLRYLQDAEAVAAAREQLGELKRGPAHRKQMEKQAGKQMEKQSMSWSLWMKQPHP